MAVVPGASVTLAKGALGKPAVLKCSFHCSWLDTKGPARVARSLAGVGGCGLAAAARLGMPVSVPACGRPSVQDKGHQQPPASPDGLRTCAQVCICEKSRDCICVRKGRGFAGVC